MGSSDIGLGETFKKDYGIGAKEVGLALLGPVGFAVAAGSAVRNVKRQSAASAAEKAAGQAQEQQTQNITLQKIIEEERRKRRLLTLSPDFQTNLAQAAGRQQLLGV